MSANFYKDLTQFLSTSQQEIQETEKNFLKCIWELRETRREEKKTKKHNSGDITLPSFKMF